MLDRIMKRPQVTSSDEWLFQGSNQVAQNQKAHHFYPTFHYDDNDTLQYFPSIIIYAASRICPITVFYDWAYHYSIKYSDHTHLLFTQMNFQAKKDLKTLNLSDIENEFMILIRLNLYYIGYTVKSQRLWWKIHKKAYSI